MAVKTIQIADKPTLDATKALLENGEYGLSAIKNAVDSGPSGSSVGGLQIEKYTDEQVNGCVSVSTLPYDFCVGSAVVLNREIHILGGNYNLTYMKYHYKYNGSSWERVSTLPYNLYGGSAIVLNGEIHILGGAGGDTSHYKYNGSSWKSVSTLPYNFSGGSAVVLNGEIHILSSSETSCQKYHYKYNGSSWERVSTLPYSFHGGSAVVLDNKIHILGSSNNNYQIEHYQFGGSSWGRVSTLPYSFHGGSAVVLDNDIHILGGTDHETSHYKYNGSWSSVYALPYGLRASSAVVLDNDIHILGGTGHETSHYIVKNDSRHIATMLPKGIRIMLSDNEDINYVSNATKISSNIAEVSETGYVEILATLPEPDDIKGYLIFY